MPPAHFIIAGAQRSGTTLLHHLLDQHPEIEMAHPVRPEPKFFLRDEAGSGGIDRYRQLLFGRKRGAHIYGEKSTSYMQRSDVAGRILALLPGVRFVFVLRDPVERAISHYKFSIVNGADQASIDEAFDREEERRNTYDSERFSTSPFAYLAGGHYDQHIGQWEAAVGRERLFLMLFEDLIRDPSSVQGLFRWLGASPFDCVMPEQPVNSSAVPVGIDPELRGRLVEHFRGSNHRLSLRYGLDVSAWQS